MIDFVCKRNRRMAPVRVKKANKRVISICSCCQKVQNEQKAWHQAETQLDQTSAAGFSHGLCPSCYEEQRAAFRKVRPRRTLQPVL